MKGGKEGGEGQVGWSEGREGERSRERTRKEGRG